jgi:ATP-dependent DNA helicase RecG
MARGSTREQPLQMEQYSFNFETSTSDYTRAELALLSPEDIFARADEILLIERKAPGIHDEELGQYFSMWANTPNGGLVVLGQRDKKAGNGFDGCSLLTPEALNNIEKRGYFHCPEARAHTKRVPVKNDEGLTDFVVVFYVEYHERRVVKTVAGKAYARRGDDKITLDADQIRELEAEKGQIDLELEPVNLEFPQDFRMDLIRLHVDNLVQEKGLSDGHPDTQILSQTRLGRIKNGKFIPNVACALLFARDPLTLFPGCKITILRFAGEFEQAGKEYNVVKRIEVEACIPELIVEAARHIRTQLREFSPLAEDNRFGVIPEYPEDAWHEAIVNACVHRSYILKNMVTFVKIFDDKFVVESPGGFPPTVTPANIYETSSPRNPHLFFALRFLKFVKCHGEGTQRMRDTMAKSELPKPEFAESHVASGFNQVRVTLRNNFKLRKLWIDSEALRVLGPQWANLKQNELRILNFVAEHGSINVVQAMRLVLSPRKWQSVKKVLDGMVKGGLLVRHSERVRDSRAVYVLPDAVIDNANSIQAVP